MDRYEPLSHDHEDDEDPCCRRHDKPAANSGGYLTLFIRDNDRGLSFESLMLPDDESGDLSSVLRLNGHVDEMVFNNPGSGGQGDRIDYRRSGLILLRDPCRL